MYLLYFGDEKHTFFRIGFLFAVIKPLGHSVAFHLAKRSNDDASYIDQILNKCLIIQSTFFSLPNRELSLFFPTQYSIMVRSNI